MTITTQDSIKIENKIMQKTHKSIENSNSYQEYTINTLEELLSGTKASCETLEEILSKMNETSKKDEREARMQEGALSLMSGMLIGGVGGNIATGGTFDILKSCPKLTKFLGSKMGKCIGGVLILSGTLLGILGIKKLCLIE